MNLVDHSKIFPSNCHDLQVIVPIPHPAVTQVVVDARPTHCVEVLMTSTCSSLSVLGPVHLGALLSPLCRVVCQSERVCTRGSPLGSGDYNLCAALCVKVNVCALGWLPLGLGDYNLCATLCVKVNACALRWLPLGSGDYNLCAALCVKANACALRWLPLGSGDYNLCAALCVKANACALRWLLLGSGGL